MNYITLKKCCLALLSFVFIPASLYAYGLSSISLSTLETEECDEETAFAFLNEDDDPLTADEASTCFIPQFNRWGWTNLLDFSTETGQSSYTLDIYAGAGQCDLTKGVDVGSVTVTYDEDSTLTFDYNLEGYVMSEAHIYVGLDAYPTNNSGIETVAPGQYTFTDSELENVQNYSVTIPVEETILYVIVHGVTLGEDCLDNGDCEDSDEDGVCDEDDVCPGYDDNIDNDGNGIPDGCDSVAYTAESLTVYPIPFKNEVNLRYAFDYDTYVNIEVFDTKGNKLTQLKNNNYETGTIANTKLDLSHIKSQLLFVRFTTVKGISTKKIISSN